MLKCLLRSAGGLQLSEDVVPAAPDALRTHTYNVLIELWLDNIAENLPSIRSNGKPLEALPKRKNDPAICLAGGPSISRYSHLELIEKSSWKHTVLSCDKTLVAALKHKIVPYAVASVDGSPAIAKFFSHKIVRKYAKEINATFNAMVHPSVTRSWNGDIYWFLNMIDALYTDDKKFNNKSITYILHVLTRRRASLISTIGNVGAFLLNLGFVLECDPLILVGYDFSEQVKYKSQAVYFNSFVEMYKQKFKDEKKARDKAAALHQVELNPDFGTFYLVNPIWKTYRDMLAKHIIESKKHIIQATGNGCLHTGAVKCSNFEAMPLKKALKKYN